ARHRATLFFFSSRRRHTRSKRDWSSDVCSSDLGGATFDSCLRYLNEDPWERLRKIRAKCPDVKLQMLLRGQNLLGYKHYPDDVEIGRASCRERGRMALGRVRMQRNAERRALCSV